jgi:hypothetical protein
VLLVQTAYAIWAGHEVRLGDQRDHGSEATGWPGDFWLWWSWEYNVSIVADTYGVILIVLLSKWFYEVHSRSREANESIATIRACPARLKEAMQEGEDLMVVTFVEEPRLRTQASAKIAHEGAAPT